MAAELYEFREKIYEAEEKFFDVEVNLVFSNKEQKLVVIKSYTINKAKPNEFNHKYKLFEKEIIINQHITELKIEGIPKYIDYHSKEFGSGEIKWSLILEYIEGENLEQLYMKKEWPTTENLLNLAGWLFKILKELHSHEIVHRDIKKSNIIIKSWENREFYLIDFGLSNIINGNQKVRYFINSRSGTFQYMSPELLISKQIGNLKKNDIWAVGLLLWDMIHKREFYEGEDLDALKYIISNPITIDENLNPILSHLIERCLILDPNSRWSAEECLKYVEPHIYFFRQRIGHPDPVLI